MEKNISADEFSAKVNKAYSGRITIVKEHIHNKLSKPWKNVLESFRESYGDKFSYDESSYVDSHHKIKIHCNDCGADFELDAQHHLRDNNGGCPNCSKTKIAKCSKCGKEIVVGRNANINNCLCNDCRKIQKSLSKSKNRRKNNHYIKNTKNTTNTYSSTKIRKEQQRKAVQKLRERRLYICPCCGQKHKYKEKCSTSDLCRKHPQKKWYRNLIPFGFDYSKIGTIEYIQEYEKVIDIIKYNYYDLKLSPRQIFEKYDCKKYFNHDTFIRNILKSENLYIRNLSESQINAIETGVHNFQNVYFYQSHLINYTSWENKTILLRSTYELDFAKMLDEQKISYDVEKLRIKYFDTQRNKERIAIPDFYLPETNTIIEVKSSYTLDKQNMIDKVKSYIENGYNFKLWFEHEFVELEKATPKKNNISCYVNKTDISVIN